MKRDYEGITVAVWMLLTAWMLIAIVKLVF
jgi:hypothetical protein